MIHTTRRRSSRLLVIFGILLSFTASASPFWSLSQTQDSTKKSQDTTQDPSKKPTDTTQDPNKKPADTTPDTTSDTNPPPNGNVHPDNGITVGQPKQFDERTLTLMLQSLEEKLVRSQFPDPSGLYNSIGRIAGATASTSSMSLSVRGPSLPSITTTSGSTTKDGTTTSLIDETSKSDTEKTGEKPETSSTTGSRNSQTTGTIGETTSSLQEQITQPGLAHCWSHFCQVTKPTTLRP